VTCTLLSLYSDLDRFSISQARPGVGSNSKPLPNNALVGGAEANGTPLYIGRAIYKVTSPLHLQFTMLIIVRAAGRNPCACFYFRVSRAGTLNRLTADPGKYRNDINVFFITYDEQEIQASIISDPNLPETNTHVRSLDTRFSLETEAM
jgi:hypothetical protein